MTCEHSSELPVPVMLAAGLCAVHAGLMRRELLVLDSCLGAGIPVAGYVGGGYDRDLAVLAERHMALHRAALRMWTDHGL